MSAEDTDFVKNLAASISKTHTTPQAQIIPEDAPFDSAQRHWLNGLLRCLQAIAAAGAAEEETPGTALSVLYGSQSGNAEALSRDLRKFSKNARL